MLYFFHGRSCYFIQYIRCYENLLLAGWLLSTFIIWRRWQFNTAPSRNHLLRFICFIPLSNSGLAAPAFPRRSRLSSWASVLSHDRLHGGFSSRLFFELIGASESTLSFQLAKERWKQPRQGCELSTSSELVYEAHTNPQDHDALTFSREFASLTFRLFTIMLIKASFTLYKDYDIIFSCILVVNK